MDNNERLNALIMRHKKLEACRGSVADAYFALEKTFAEGGKLLIAGNGGSSADADHIVGELMKSFANARVLEKESALSLTRAHARGADIAAHLQGGLKTIALGAQTALVSAYINDVDGGEDYVYAQQVWVYGDRGDAFLGISTSGNSANIINAAITAKARGMTAIALTGAGGGELADICDIAVKVPETETHLVQELHIPVYHCLCLMLEDRFFGGRG